MLCTSKQKLVIKIGTAEAYAALPPIRVESELSTILDFDEIRLFDRIGEGSFGVVFAGTVCCSALCTRMAGSALRMCLFGLTIDTVAQIARRHQAATSATVQRRS